jgi:hypothetical protein
MRRMRNAIESNSGPLYTHLSGYKLSSVITVGKICIDVVQSTPLLVARTDAECRWTMARKNAQAWRTIKAPSQSIKGHRNEPAARSVP